ncbi:MAG: response regulator, partial [Candidatus Dormibacteraeota bacterium]|nr:response regulator [Candidatus Dormibacteraeota bacterium]
MPDAPAPTQARKRVLIVEDESAIRNVVTEILRRDGFEVIEASAGQVGIRTAVSREPDIILLDWVLPDISGLDVCREIRRQGVLCPVLMLTGRSSKVDMVVGLEVGADDYIT